MHLQKTKCTSTHPTAYLGQIKVDSKHNIRYNIEELATIQFINRPNQKPIAKPTNKSFIKSHQRTFTDLTNTISPPEAAEELWNLYQNTPKMQLTDIKLVTYKPNPTEITSVIWENDKSESQFCINNYSWPSTNKALCTALI